MALSINCVHSTIAQDTYNINTRKKYSSDIEKMEILGKSYSNHLWFINSTTKNFFFLSIPCGT